MASAPAFALTAMMVSLACLAGIVLAVAVAALNRGGHREDATDPFDALVASRFTIPVSLIVPASGEAPGLSPAVGSLLSLNYPELEVITVAEDLTESGFEHLKAEWDLEPKEFFYRRTLTTTPIRRIYGGRRDARLMVVDKPAAGKADALNCGSVSRGLARRVHAAHDLPRFERTPAADVTGVARLGHGSRCRRARRAARRSRQHGRRLSVDCFRSLVDDDAPHVEPSPVRYCGPARDCRRVATRRPSQTRQLLPRRRRLPTASVRPVADLDDRPRDRTGRTRHGGDCPAAPNRVRLSTQLAARAAASARCSSRWSNCRRSIAAFMDVFP